MCVRPFRSIQVNINFERVQSFQYLGAMFTTNGDGASNIKTAAGDGSASAK